MGGEESLRIPLRRRPRVGVVRTGDAHAPLGKRVLGAAHRALSVTVSSVPDTRKVCTRCHTETARTCAQNTARTRARVLSICVLLVLSAEMRTSPRAESAGRHPQSTHWLHDIVNSSGTIPFFFSYDMIVPSVAHGAHYGKWGALQGTLFRHVLGWSGVLAILLASPLHPIHLCLELWAGLHVLAVFFPSWLPLSHGCTPLCEHRSSVMFRHIVVKLSGNVTRGLVRPFRSWLSALSLPFKLLAIGLLACSNSRPFSGWSWPVFGCGIACAANASPASLPHFLHVAAVSYQMHGTSLGMVSEDFVLVLTCSSFGHNVTVCTVLGPT